MEGRYGAAFRVGPLSTSVRARRYTCPYASHDGSSSERVYREYFGAEVSLFCSSMAISYVSGRYPEPLARKSLAGASIAFFPCCPVVVNAATRSNVAAGYHSCALGHSSRSHSLPGRWYSRACAMHQPWERSAQPEIAPFSNVETLDFETLPDRHRSQSKYGEQSQIPRFQHSS